MVMVGALLYPDPGSVTVMPKMEPVVPITTVNVLEPELMLENVSVGVLV